MLYCQTINLRRYNITKKFKIESCLYDESHPILQEKERYPKMFGHCLKLITTKIEPMFRSSIPYFSKFKRGGQVSLRDSGGGLSTGSYRGNSSSCYEHFFFKFKKKFKNNIVNS